jgi:hypothetical protein
MNIKPIVRVTAGERPEKVIVACVMTGDKYKPEYVYKLRDAVKRNLTICHDFVCLTDNAQELEFNGIEHCRIDNPKRSWWDKFHLFNPRHFAAGTRVIYFDLDVVICDCIDDIASVADSLAMVENFSPNRKHAPHNSSVMSFVAGSEEAQIIWEGWSARADEFIARNHGDQETIAELVEYGRDYTVPNFRRERVVSFKYDIKKHPLGCQQIKPQIIIFHGEPNPHQVKSDRFVQEHWL